MVDIYRQLWVLMTRQERRRFFLLMVATIIMSLFELAGVGVILPFLSVVADPGVVETNPVLAGFADFFGLRTPEQIMIGVGLAAFAVIVIGMIVRAAVTYLQFRFSLMRSYSIASRLLHGYLSQDYIWQVSRNSSDLASSILSEVDQVVRETLLPAVLLISNVLVLALITGLIFAVAPGVAFGATGLLLGIYAAFFVALRKRLTILGKDRMAANQARFRSVQEIAGGFKELKVSGIEAQSLRRFRSPAETFAQTQTASQVIARLPRFALEAAVYGGFIVMVLVLILLRGETIAALVPLFGLLGMAATRLFPAMQNLYQFMSQIRFSAPALERLSQNLSEAEARHLPPRPPSPLPMTRSIALDAISFTYPGSAQPVLDALSLTIPARSSIGIVGGTGAGKTTAIDILLGLLHPDSGHLRIDGQILGDDKLRAWQRNIGYVPQSIFLLDDSVAANIAFGAGDETPDMTAVERAARIANLHDFVTSELPKGYATTVGERGVRLSGGQRQRIGIARALYRDPEVLVLDEATSALDTLTEKAVMEAVRNLGGTKTVAMIAHRLSTVRECDIIFLLEKGRVAAQGTYDELVAENAVFRSMSNASV